MLSALTVTALLATACGAAAGHDQVPTTAPGYGTSLDGPVPESILDAPLVDENGHHVTLATWRGKTIVLSDVMTLCQETCPLVTASMVAAAREVDHTPFGRDVEFVSLTIDPGRDDLRHLRAYRREFGELPNWTVLRGSPGVVDRLWDRLGVWRRETRMHPPYATDWLTGRPLTTDIAHTDELIFINGDQRFSYELEGAGNVAPRQIPGRIHRFMDALGRHDATSPDAGSWTPRQVTGALRWVLGSGPT